MADHPKSSPRPQNSTSISFSKPGTAPPVFVATSFTSPPWAPLEMSAKAKEPIDDKAPKEFLFSKDFDDVPDGLHHYKFRLGPGDWWSVAEDQKTDIDEHGNRNNVLLVGSGKPASSNESKPSTIDAVKDTVKDAGSAAVSKVNPASGPAVLSAAAGSGSLSGQESSDKKSSVADAVKAAASTAAASVSNAVTAAASPASSSPKPEHVPLPPTPATEPPAKRARLSFSAAPRSPNSTPVVAEKSIAGDGSPSPSSSKTSSSAMGKAFTEHEAHSLVATLAFLKFRIDAVLENARRGGLDVSEIDAITEHEPGHFPNDTEDVRIMPAAPGKTQASPLPWDTFLCPLLGGFVGCTISWIVMCWVFGMPRGKA